MNATNLQSTEINESAPKEATKPSMAPDSTNRTRSTVAIGSETLSPPADRLPSEMSSPMPPAADRRAGMSLAESALRDVDEAVTTTTNIPRSTVVTGSETLSPPTDRLPSEMSTLMPPADARAGMLPAENALHDADKVMTTINLSNTREGVLERIKWVMDTVSPVTEVRCGVLCCQPLTEPNLVVSFTRMQRWHMVYFLRSPR